MLQPGQYTCIFQKCSNLANQSQILCEASIGCGYQCVCKSFMSYDQDGRHAHMYGKNPSKIFFSGTGGPISKKFGMKHRRLKYYNVYINHDSMVTLIYFTTRST